MSTDSATKVSAGTPSSEQSPRAALAIGVQGEKHLCSWLLVLGVESCPISSKSSDTGDESLVLG